MKEGNQLTLEQRFKLALYNKKFTNMKEYYLRKYLIVILKKMMIKDNIIKYSIKNLIN